MVSLVFLHSFVRLSVGADQRVVASLIGLDRFRAHGLREGTAGFRDLRTWNHEISLEGLVRSREPLHNRLERSSLNKRPAGIHNPSFKTIGSGVVAWRKGS